MPQLTERIPARATTGQPAEAPPASPRREDVCLVCGTPLAGMLGALARGRGIRRSVQNPNLCNRCDVHVQEGAIVEIAVLFADLTGYTKLTHDLGPDRTHQIMDRFFRTAKESIVEQDGFVSQFAGDQILAFFNMPLRSDDFAARAVNAARALLRRLPTLEQEVGVRLQARVGIATGYARVGRVGSDDSKDFTAIGDVVNRAARLVSRVQPGGILVDAEVFESVREQFPDAVPEQARLKGFSESVDVVTLVGEEKVAAARPQRRPAPRRLRAAALLMALVGAPCAGLILLNPLALVAGLGAGALGSGAAFLDQTWLRLPLLGLATAVAVGSLGFILYRRLSNSAAPRTDALGVLDPAGPGVSGVTVSLVALCVVVFELVAHQIMH